MNSRLKNMKIADSITIDNKRDSEDLTEIIASIMRDSYRDKHGNYFRVNEKVLLKSPRGGESGFKVFNILGDKLVMLQPEGVYGKLNLSIIDIVKIILSLYAGGR